MKAKTRTRKLFNTHKSDNGEIFNQSYSIESLFGDETITNTDSTTESNTEQIQDSVTESEPIIETSTTEELIKSVTSEPNSEEINSKIEDVQQETSTTIKMQAPSQSVFQNVPTLQSLQTQQNQANVPTLSIPQLQSNSAAANNVANSIRKRLTPEDIRDIPYKKARLMTRAEARFYHILKDNLYSINKIEIFGKVNLWDLVDIDRTKYNSDYPRQLVKGFHSDYVVVDKETFEVICTIELDDCTHKDLQHQQNDATKNAVLDTAGIQQFRIGVQIQYVTKDTIKEIDKFINNVYAPICPYCKIKMEHKAARTTGHRFYGCPNYNNDKVNCTYTINID